MATKQPSSNPNTAPSAINWHRFLPFLSWLGSMDRHSIRGDFFAGLTGAVIVLPQGVAYAMIAGLPLEYGLYAAIIPAIIAALFGSSHHLISGPTASMSIVFFTTLSPLAEPGTAEFIQLALTLTLMAGLFQLLMALAKLGSLVNFVSQTVVIGFIAGAAVVIATSQINHALGIELTSSGSVIQTWQAIYQLLPSTNPYALMVALTTFIICLLFKRYLPRWPGMLIAMTVGSLVVAALGAEEHDIDLIGAIPAQLPGFALPGFSEGLLRELGPGALALALLGLVEAVSIARAVSTRSHQMVNGNQEFYGQALSNICGSFFSCLASSGSFTRTGINFSSGAKTPLAAIFAAISLAAIILLLSDLTAYVPIPSMAGILLLVAYGLIDVQRIRSIIKTDKSEALVLGVTFAATLLMAMQFAIYIGVVLSLILYLKNTSKPSMIALAPNPEATARTWTNITLKPLPECPQLKIVRIDGSFLFTAVHYLQEQLYLIPEPNVLIVSSGVNFIDIAGAEMLVHEANRRRKLGGRLYFYKMKFEPKQILASSGHIDTIGRDAFFDSKVAALQQIQKALPQNQCANCTKRIFSECQHRYGQPSHNAN
ncbi:MAG: SulP family inorganic anion transporter [Motiliproteus sp.]